MMRSEMLRYVAVGVDKVGKRRAKGARVSAARPIFHCRWDASRVSWPEPHIYSGRGAFHCVPAAPIRVERRAV